MVELISVKIFQASLQTLQEKIRFIPFQAFHMTHMIATYKTVPKDFLPLSYLGFLKLIGSLGRVILPSSLKNPFLDASPSIFVRLSILNFRPEDMEKVQISYGIT